MSLWLLGNNGLFAKLAAALSRPELATDPRYLTNGDRAHHVDALKAEVEAELAKQPTAIWLEALEAAGVPCGPINNVAEVLADPQVLARNMVVTVHDQEAGTLSMAGNPIKLSAFDDPAGRGRVPRLDEHRDILLDEVRKRR